MNRNEREESGNRANLQKKAFLLILLFVFIFDERDTCTSLYAKKKELIRKERFSMELIKRDKY